MYFQVHRKYFGVLKVNKSLKQDESDLLTNLESCIQKINNLEAKIQENKEEKMEEETVTHEQQSDYTKALNQVIKTLYLAADVSLNQLNMVIRTYLYVRM